MLSDSPSHDKVLSPELTQRSPVSWDGQAKWAQLLSAAIRIFTNRDVAVYMAPVECIAVARLERLVGVQINSMDQGH